VRRLGFLRGGLLWGVVRRGARRVGCRLNFSDQLLCIYALMHELRSDSSSDFRGGQDGMEDCDAFAT
jgi:hypothetical protein